MIRQLKQFIQNNRDLINENSKESWRQIYNKLNNSTLKGEFTKTLLSAGIDPTKILNYIPNYYLHGANITDYKIPDSVTSIGDSAFYSCSRLTSITIPDSVTVIGEWAFMYCKSLTSIEIPDSVTSIGYGAFAYCDSLTSVEIGNGVTSIEDWAFYHCDNLKEINFKGTEKQAINCGIGNRSKKKQREYSSIQKIICSDGVIYL